MTDNETKLCRAYAKSMGKTLKGMKQDYEQAILKEAISHYQGKRSKDEEINALASALSEAEIGVE